MFLKPFIISILSAEVQIANPALPLTLIGIGILAVLLVVCAKARRRKKKSNKYLIKDSTFEVEVEASEKKRGIKKKLDEYCKTEHYNYTSGYIPGSQPELSFIDPARRGDALERIKVKETYAPEMIIPSSAVKAGEMPLESPYNSYSPKKPAPIMTQPTLPPMPPTLTPVPDVSEIKMPNTMATPPSIPVPIAEKFSGSYPEMPKPLAPLDGVTDNVGEKRKKRVKASPKEQKPETRAVAEEPISELASPKAEESGASPRMSAAKSVPIAVPVAAVKRTEKKAPSAKAELPEEPKIAMSAPIKKVPEAVYGKPDVHRVTINQTPVSFARVPVKPIPKSEYSVSENESLPTVSEFADVEGVESDFEEVESLVATAPEMEKDAVVEEPASEPVEEPTAEPVEESTAEPVEESAVEPSETEAEDLPVEEIAAVEEEAVEIAPVPELEPAREDAVEEIADEEPQMPTVEEYDLPTVAPELPKKEAAASKPAKKPVAKKPTPKAAEPTNPYQNQFAATPNFGDFSNYFAKSPAPQPIKETAKAAPQPKKAEAEANEASTSNVVVIRIPDEIKAMYKLTPEDLGLDSNEAE